uniref:hypothetical protein n=1 Tax=Sphingomonas bacterium TaxID=1895847 RepID=UPI00262E3EA7|nr:hypothetical protein [Sphingomonas bacterium]
MEILLEKAPGCTIPSSIRGIMSPLLGKMFFPAVPGGCGGIIEERDRRARGDWDRAVRSAAADWSDIDVLLDRIMSVAWMFMMLFFRLRSNSSGLVSGTGQAEHSGRFQHGQAWV